MKKRLLIYLSVIIGCLFIGFTVAYLLTNHEVISAVGSDVYYLNINEVTTIDINHTHPSKDTKIEYKVSDEGIISFDDKTGKITALSGGSVDITITPTNEKFGPFEFRVIVGDGKSEMTPFYIKSAEDLKAIGGERVYKKDAAKGYDKDVSSEWSRKAFYQLLNDIDLKGIEWTPIGVLVDDFTSTDNKPFTGQFFGDGKSIKNLKVTKTTNSAGLFAFLADNAIVEAIKFENASIKGEFDYAGIVSGYSEGATISQIEAVNSEVIISPRVLENDDDEEIIQVIAIAGGIIGETSVAYWREPGSVLGGYAYERTNVTMCSFSGTIGATDEFVDISKKEGHEVYLSLGGVIGYNAGATIFNNKTEVTFDVSQGLVIWSIGEFNFDIGGIVGFLSTVSLQDKDGVYIENEDGEHIKIQPLVKNNLAIMTLGYITDETGGVIGATAEDVEVEGSVLGNYYHSPGGNITTGGLSSPNATVVIGSTQMLASKDTYKTSAIEPWNIGEDMSVWTIGEGDASPRINFESGIPQEVKYLEGPYKISNAAEFVFYHEKMTAPTETYGEIRSKKFWLSQNYILGADVNLAEVNISEFVPIGYDYTFMGTFDGNGHKLYFDKDESITMFLKNTKTKDGYTYPAMGLFSVLKGTVKNLTLENFTVDFGEFAGVIAGVNSGYIIDCLLVNPEIKNGIIYGLMAGANKGTIINTTTEYEVEEEIAEEGKESEEHAGIPYSIELTNIGKTLGVVDSDNNIYVGSVTGYNTGTISNIKISGELFLDAEASTHESKRVIGGVVGYNKGLIEMSSISKAYISDKSLTQIYIGGFCGINDGEITKSYTGQFLMSPTTIIVNKTKGAQIAGGFAATIGYEGKVSQSFANVSVEGYYISGFSPNLLGEVSESYVKGDLTGEYVGGFSNTLSSLSNTEQGGIILNCYTVLKITGVSDSSVIAGISLLIQQPGKIENSFFSNTFAGNGKKHLEAFTDTRSNLYKVLLSWLKSPSATGKVNNVVIDVEAEGNNSKDIIESGKLFNDKTQVVFYISKDTALNASEILTQAKFDVGATGIWFIEAGYMPSLNNLDLDGVLQNPPIEEPKEEPGKPGDSPGEGAPGTGEPGDGK